MIAKAVHAVLCLPVWGLDVVLRRLQGIRQFTHDPRCLIRIAAGESDRSLTLGDGHVVSPGDAVVELHLWNERLPRVPATGADLAWGRVAYDRVAVSLTLLAEELRTRPWCSATAVRAEFLIGGPRQTRLWMRLMQRLGFDAFRPDAATALPARARRLGEDLLAWALMGTFNAGGLRGRPLRCQRLSCWISRRRLLETYGQRGTDPPRHLTDLAGTTRS